MTGDCHSTKKEVKRYYKSGFVDVVVVAAAVVVAFIVNCLVINLPPKRKKCIIQNCVKEVIQLLIQ